MKILPDQPHLDHLRQQAKDLLAGLRDSRPDASLADAQAALAQRYGFRTWTDLKAEVDTRRGTAPTADPELARMIAARYGLGEVTGAMRSLARADEVGRPWSLATRRPGAPSPEATDRWLVRSLDNWWPIVDVERELALRQAAAAEGVLVPAVVRSASGAVVESAGGQEWRVYEWLPSGPPLVAPVSAGTTYAVGGILAKLHRLRHPVDRISPWHVSRLSDVAWGDLVAKATAGDARWAPALAGMVPTLAGLETIRDDAPAAPVLSHNALGPGSVRRSAPSRLVVAGWEHAGGQPPAWELANALMDWAIDPGGGVNVAGARAMVGGYRDEAGSVPPLDLPAWHGAVTGLLNYVCGEVEYALDAKDPDERRHADRSVHHLLTHLPSRAGLERLLAALT